MLILGVHMVHEIISTVPVLRAIREPSTPVNFGAEPAVEAHEHGHFASDRKAAVAAAAVSPALLHNVAGS